MHELAMVGARPLALTAVFVLEEGCPIATLQRIVADMAEAATGAGVDTWPATPRWSSGTRQTSST
jgi:hydrogenase expression/formation protein HypE